MSKFHSEFTTFSKDVPPLAGNLPSKIFPDLCKYLSYATSKPEHSLKMSVSLEFHLLQCSDALFKFTDYKLFSPVKQIN